MATEPLPTILDRHANVAAVQPFLEIAGPLLREVVNEGTRVFRRCDYTGPGDWTSKLAPLLLYYHSLQMTDGIEVLLSSSCSAAAKPLLRSSFEALLHLEYIAEADSDHRSRQWMVCHLHDRIRSGEQYDASKPEGNRVAAGILADEQRITERLRQALPAILAEAQGLRNLLMRPELAPIEAEYLTHRRPPPFYALFNGPQSVRELAVRLDRELEYHFLYRHWSELLHARDVRRLYGRSDEGTLGYSPLRDPAEMRNAATFAVTFQVAAMKALLAIARPGEDLTPWIKREVTPLMHRMQSAFAPRPATDAPPAP